MAIFRLYDSVGSNLHSSKRTLNSAVVEAKKCGYPVQVCEEIDNKLILKYAHIPNNRDVRGTQMSSSMLRHNIYANSL